jgi:hypothetical protein
MQKLNCFSKPANAGVQKWRFCVAGHRKRVTNALIFVVGKVPADDKVKLRMPDPLIRNLRLPTPPLFS